MSTDRTDTDRLNWLIEEGFIVELRRYMDGQWGFDVDDGNGYEGPSARAAIDAVMDAPEDNS